MKINVDKLSLSSCRVVVHSTTGAMSSATSFVVQVVDRLYLVTNWHVVTGTNPHTGELLDPSGHPPHALEFQLHPKGKGMPTVAVEVIHEDGNPRWLEHPTLGRNLDVVAFELPDEVDPTWFDAFDPSTSREEIAVFPGMPVSIVGFPLGMKGPISLPIWKTGHIATDFDVDTEFGPCFYIDATTRGGMSGSPVFLSCFNGFTSTDGNYHLDTGRQIRWLGVYSGRIHGDSEIGIVWRAKTVLELLTAGKRPR